MQTMKVQFHIIFLHCSCIWIAFPLLGTCVPPPPPLTCNSSASSCTICNAFGTWPDRIPCRAASMVVYPSTEDEILHAVAGCVRKKLKMKVVTASSHTIPKFACPGSGDGAGILISTQRYNKEITVDKAAMTVTADSGVGLRDLLDAVAVSGLALVAAPYWEGVSLGGLLSTGSHGTSLWRRGGAVHDYVLSMRLVIPALPQEGYAKVVTLKQGDPDLNAAMVSLGVLGVISKVTLTLEPQFKRSVTNLVKDDINLEEEILPFAAANEFGDLTWYSSQRRVVHRIDNRVPVTTPGNGFNDFVGFQKVSIPVAAALRATESLLEKTKKQRRKVQGGQTHYRIQARFC